MQGQSVDLIDARKGDWLGVFRIDAIVGNVRLGHIHYRTGHGVYGSGLRTNGRREQLKPSPKSPSVYATVR